MLVFFYIREKGSFDVLEGFWKNGLQSRKYLNICASYPKVLQKLGESFVRDRYFVLKVFSKICT